MTEFVRYNAWCVKHGFKASNPGTLNVYLILNGMKSLTREHMKKQWKNWRYKNENNISTSQLL